MDQHSPALSATPLPLLDREASEQVGHELGPALVAEFAKDVRHVGVDGLRRDRQLVGYGARVEPLEQQPGHAQLHVGEA